MSKPDALSEVRRAFREELIAAMPSTPANGPPRDEESEDVVFAALLTEGAGQMPPPWLSPEDFFLSHRQRFYQAIQAICGRGERPTPANVIQELAKKQDLDERARVQFAEELHELAYRRPFHAYWEQRARDVVRMARKRDAIRRLQLAEYALRGPDFEGEATAHAVRQILDAAEELQAVGECK